MSFYKNVGAYRVLSGDDSDKIQLGEIVRIPGHTELYICAECDPELSVLKSTIHYQCRRCSCGEGGKPCFQCGSDEREDGKDVVLRPVEESNSHQTQLSLLLVDY